MFGGRKQSFGFLNWQRAKVLLKLEFDTEDHVLFPLYFLFLHISPKFLVSSYFPCIFCFQYGQWAHRDEGPVMGICLDKGEEGLESDLINNFGYLQ